MNDITESTNDLKVHQLIYVPHPSLEMQVPEFPSGQAQFRREIGQHMTELMHTHRGVGLAANQINFNAAVFVQKMQGEVVTLFNPQIHEVSEDKVLMTEGCLSDPGMYLKISRPDMIKVSWENAEGDREKTTLFGLDCRVFLHEYDHLQGVLFTDRVKLPKLKMARKKQEKRMEQFLKS